MNSKVSSPAWLLSLASCCAALSWPSSAAWAGDAASSVSLAMRSDYAATAGDAAVYGSLAATAQLRFGSPGHAYATVLLVEYSFVQDRADTAIVAGIFAYHAPRWTVSVAPYFRKPAASAGE